MRNRRWWSDRCFGWKLQWRWSLVETYYVRTSGQRFSRPNFLLAGSRLNTPSAYAETKRRLFGIALSLSVNDYR